MSVGNFPSASRVATKHVPSPRQQPSGQVEGLQTLEDGACPEVDAPPSSCAMIVPSRSAPASPPSPPSTPPDPSTPLPPLEAPDPPRVPEVDGEMSSKSADRPQPRVEGTP